MTGAAVVASGAVLAGSVTAAQAAPTTNTTTARSTSASVQAAAARKAQIKAATIRKYGVYPLPVRGRDIKRYHLSKTQLRQIAAAKKLARTAEARKIRKCESGGNYRSIDRGYYGAYQFDRGTWLSNGGGRYARTANKAPKWAQDHIMWKTHRARGWSPWTCA
jgi:hypothetical protein